MRQVLPCPCCPCPSPGLTRPHFFCRALQFGDVALHIAALAGKAEVCEALIELGANVNVENVKGWTPLHNAAATGQTKAVLTLLNASAMPNVINKFKDTPLHEAARKSHIEVIGLLLEYDAYVNAVSDFGETPLHEAAKAGKRSSIQALMTAGADPTIKNKRRLTAVQVARNAKTADFITTWKKDLVVTDEIEDDPDAKRVIDMNKLAALQSQLGITPDAQPDDDLLPRLLGGDGKPTGPLLSLGSDDGSDGTGGAADASNGAGDSEDGDVLGHQMHRPNYGEGQLLVHMPSFKSKLRGARFERARTFSIVEMPEMEEEEEDGDG